MDHIGMDAHKKESQICILTEAGELIERRVRSQPERSQPEFFSILLVQFQRT